APIVILRAEGKTVKDGVYSAEQAKRGEQLYTSKCAECHGENLRGIEYAPALGGSEFLRVWNERPLSDLMEKIQGSMPQTTPGSLKGNEVADIIGYMLQYSKFPAGQTELSSSADALKDITIITR